MTIGTEIRELNRAEPFTPYTIHTTDGKALFVKHPDYCLISPGDYVVYVFETENKRTVVAVANVASVEHGIHEASSGDR